MARYSSRDTQPLKHWNSIPIYLTTILTAVFVGGLALSAVLISMQSPLLAWLVFAMPLEPGWSIWRVLTYVFVGQITFFTPFSILFFYWLSVGIETHLGRRLLTRLLLLITLVTPAMAALWWWGFGIGSNTFLNNSYMLLSGLIVAFATLYPQTEAMNWVPFKWIAFACIVCGSLMLLAFRDWVGLSQLWGSCAAAYGYTRHAFELDDEDYQSPISKFRLWWKRPKLRVVRTPSAGAPRRSALEEGNLSTDVDILLDKIARSGMNSLTAKERARLEKAREALLKKDHQ
ncbi:MAG TPA: DUF6576 domain-containing protein [Chthoniobacteraceae bacterium]|jgi:hypothetical protein|nr:DUF6576 domain-containing protein [Chthoniobacteraceae bacterium]